MYLNAIIFAKLQKIYATLDTASMDPYSLVFAPTTISFTNFDFNFLNPNSLSAAEIIQNQENAMAFAQIANTVNRDAKIFQLNTDEMLQDAYSDILNNALLIETTLTDEDKSAYNAARAILFTGDSFDLTSDYIKYKEMQVKMSEMNSKISDVNNILSQGDITLSLAASQQKEQLEQQKNILLNDWIVNYKKDKIEDALKIAAGLNERSAYKSNFNSELVNFSGTLNLQTTAGSNFEYLPTYCLPNDIYQYDYSGWKKVIMESGEISAVENEAKSFLGVDVYNANNISADIPVAKIEFEYLFVTIQRNWFKKDIVNSRYWKFKSGAEAVVSEGLNSTGGILPGFTDKFIFARRILQYLAPDSARPTAEVSHSAPANYQFSRLAKLGNISKLKATIQPEHTEVSKIRLTGLETNRQTIPFILERNSSVIKPDLLRKPMAPAPGRAGQPALNIRDTNTGEHVNTQIITGKIFFPNSRQTDQYIPVVLPQPAAFPLIFSFVDSFNNVIPSLDIELTNIGDGTHYSALTDNTGKVSFNSMKLGKYHLQIHNNEVFEDFENSYEASASLTTTITLQKRINPKFNMWILGCVNYKFPKLPDSLDTCNYS